MSKRRTEANRCVMCKKPLEPGAKKCTECDSFQNPFRRWLQASNTVLALLVALVSVTGVMAKPIREALARHDSDIQAAFFWSEPDKLALFVSNRGTRRGGIRRVVLTEGAKEPRSLHIAAGRVVDPGKTEELLIFSPNPVLPEFHPDGDAPTSCLLAVYVRNFTGKQSHPQEIRVPCRVRQN